MDVNIQEVVSTVRAVDGDSVLSPRTLAGIVSAVLRAVEERQLHEQRVRAEQCVSRGLPEQLEEEP
jgi:hypothetical protein